jgi:hypothetical protein
VTVLQVSGWFHQYYAKKLFSDRRFATHPVEAMADSLIVLEDLLVRGAFPGFRMHVLGRCSPCIAGVRFMPFRCAAVPESGVDTQLSGSTAAIALLRGDMVHAINVGDSRVVAGVSSKGGRVQPQQLTVDHKPDVPAERARIVAVGGRVLATRNKYAAAPQPCCACAALLRLCRVFVLSTCCVVCRVSLLFIH